MDSGWQLVFQILVALSAAMLLGLLFERLRLSAIIGYLLAGAIAGSLGLVEHGHELHVFAEIGVAMLLFTIGLEFSFSELRRMGIRMLIGGVTAILASIAVMSGIALAFGVSPNAAVLLGCAGALSSTAVVLRILRDKNDLDSKHGRTALGVLILQDVAIVPLVLIAELMASPGKSIASQLTLALGASVFLVLVLVVFVSKIVPRLLPEQVVAKNRELPIILAIVTCIGATWAAHHLKLSPALGAFFAGMLLADAKYSQQIRADVFPLRTLFVTLFFVSIGLLADLSWLLAHLPLVLLGTVVVLSVKTVATYFALRPFVPGIIEVLATAVAISQIGEFSFVIMTIGKDSGIIPEDLFQLVIGTTLFTLILTPFTVGNALRISRFLAKRVFPARKLAASERLSRAVSLNEHLVIIGYGEAGQGAAHAVNSYSFEKLIIDLDPKLVRLAERHGFKAMIGDATNHEILEHAQIFNAMAIIIAVPDHNASRMITGVCKSVAPGVPLIVRARYHVHKDELDMVGADTVVDEEELVGRALGEEACRLGGMQATKSKSFSWDSDENYA